MRSNAKTVREYIEKLPKERKDAFLQLRSSILKNLPKGFKETVSYGMIGYNVPHSIYPDGYHCDPKLPLPFAHVANQKNSISFYHYGIYANKKLLQWFLTQYQKQTNAKLDMGKSCIRFKKMEEIPYKLIGELMTKISIKQWIKMYETTIKKKRI